MSKGYSFVQQRVVTRSSVMFFKPAFNDDMVKLSQVLQQLHTFSGRHFHVFIQNRQDCQPGMAYPESHIIIDSKLLRQPIEVIAFVLAHEWGHQILNHPRMPPYTRSSQETSQREDDADRYAVSFHRYFGYSLAPVYFFNQCINYPSAWERNQKIAHEWQSLELSYGMPRLLA